MKHAQNIVSALLLALFLARGSASAQQIQSMKLLTSQVGWAQSGGRLYWTTDDGAHWKDVTPPNPLKDVIADTFFLDVNMGWVLFSGGNEEAEFELAATTDGGSNWHVTHLKIPANRDPSMALDGWGTMFFVNAQHGWMNLRVKSGSAFRLGILLMTKDGGKTWEWAPDGSDAGAGAIYFLTPTDGWIAGGPGDEQLYVTHDGAKSWHDVALKPPPIITKEYTGTYVAPIFQDRKHGFLPVTYTDSSTDNDEAVLVLFSSDDSGQTWKTDRVVPKRVYLSGGNVPATVADSVLLTAPDSNSKGTLQLTAVPPGGKASTTVAHVSNGGAGVSQLSFTDPWRGWVSTPNELFSTQDGGVTWTNITPGKVSGTRQSKRSYIRVTITPKIQGTVRVRPVETANASVIVDTQLGFESCGAPSPADTNTWMEYSPYFDIGIYIGGVSRSCKNAGLVPKWISTVEGQGWGIAPIWVGPQAPCACWKGKPGPTCVPFPHVFHWDPPTASNDGAQEADSAAAAAASLGLPASVVYLDIESYTSSPTCSAAVQAFLDGWVGEMHLKGFSAGAGVYGSSVNMQTDFSQISPLPDEAWIAEYPSKTTAPSVSIWGMHHLCDIYSNPPCPTLWSADQRIHQYLAGENETWGKVKINIDADIINAPVAHPTTGTKIYAYNFTSLALVGNQDYAYSINNIGAANPNYGGFINGSQSDISGNIGQALGLEEFQSGGVFDWSNLLWNPDTGVYQAPPPYPQLGDCYGTQTYHCTQMTGINNAGWIVGYWTDLNNVNHGFLNQAGSLMSIDDPSAGGQYPGTWATAINDAGLITGYYSDSNGIHGFIYNAQTQQFVGGPLDAPGSAGDTVPLGINGYAQIVGWYYDGTATQGFIYSNGNFTTVPGTCGASAVPESINDNGQIVGYYQPNIKTGYFVSYNLGVTCTATTDGSPYSINDAGQLGGSYYDSVNNALRGYVDVPQTP